VTDGKGSGSRRAPLSRELVLDAARAQVDDAGLESLSSRTLAARLDVTPMALYRHVEDMDEVIGVIVDRLLEDLGTPPPSPDWQSWLEQLAQAFRADLRTHPDMLALFARRPITSPAARQRLQAAIDVLGGAGFSTDEATRAYAAVHTYTIGFSALEEGRRRTPAPSGPLDAPDDPASVTIRGFVSEDQFVHGLRALIVGLGSADPR
jgi:TetR/AcrR family tetracycline transcriptional repressor